MSVSMYTALCVKILICVYIPKCLNMIFIYIYILFIFIDTCLCTYIYIHVYIPLCIYHYGYTNLFVSRNIAWVIPRVVLLRRPHLESQRRHVPNSWVFRDTPDTPVARNGSLQRWAPKTSYVNGVKFSAPIFGPENNKGVSFGVNETWH